MVLLIECNTSKQCGQSTSRFVHWKHKYTRITTHFRFSSSDFSFWANYCVTTHIVGTLFRQMCTIFRVAVSHSWQNFNVGISSHTMIVINVTLCIMVPSAYWDTLVHTSFVELDRISRSHRRQTVQTESRISQYCIIRSSWNLSIIISTYRFHVYKVNKMYLN